MAQSAKDSITAMLPTGSGIESSSLLTSPDFSLLDTTCHLLRLHTPWGPTHFPRPAPSLLLCLDLLMLLSPVHLSTRSGLIWHPMNEALNSFLDQLGVVWLLSCSSWRLLHSCHILRCPYLPVSISTNGDPLRQGLEFLCNLGPGAWHLKIL